MAETLREVLSAHENDIVDRYVGLMQSSSQHYLVTPAEDIARNVRRSLQLMGTLYRDPENAEARTYIMNLCQQRVPQGFRLGEVMHAIFLLAEVLEPVIWSHYADDRATEHEAMQQMRIGLNRLALLWAEGYFELQESLLARKERAMRALSTPVIRVWDKILTLPLIGDVDEERSRQITEDLLQTIIETRCSVVLLDITGIGAVDTSVIGKLIGTVRAAELIGANCWVVGVSPAVASTIVQLGIDLGSITTYANLRQGLDHAFRRLGLAVVPSSPAT